MDTLDFKQIFLANLDTLIDLLKIKSIYDADTVTSFTPYGKEVNDALLFMKHLAVKDGFRVLDYAGRAIAICYGNSNNRIDIASHLDVVWANDEEFNIRIEDNRLYGRGTVDMKVPMFLTYLSLKMLKNKYPEINKQIRIVLGCDEERTMEDMKYYISKAGYPQFAFTPDGYFPMGIGEKGALMWTLFANYQGPIIYLKGGSQCNVVPARAQCLLDRLDIERIKNYISTNNIDASVQEVDDKSLIIVNGIAAHASKPQLGHSAVLDLLKLVKDLYNDELCSNLYDIFENSYGLGFLGKDNKDLSVNLGTICIESDKLQAQVDCRYPFNTNCNDLSKQLANVCLADVSLDYNDDPTLCNENDPYVKILLNNYRNITKDYSDPVISSGVSYSKVFKHCVSYGPCLLADKQMAHQDGEYVCLEDCYRWFKIYYEAIEQLIIMEMENE